MPTAPAVEWAYPEASVLDPTNPGTAKKEAHAGIHPSSHGCNPYPGGPDWLAKRKAQMPPTEESSRA